MTRKLILIGYSILATCALAQQTGEACVGITVWRLRPGETPVRAAVGAPLEDGEKLRIDVAATRNGYLYVIVRPVFANGAKGNASLLYPVAGNDNRVVPGGTIQIPGNSFFMLRRERDDQVNETLTLLILPQSIADPLNTEKIVELEGRWKAAMFQCPANPGDPLILDVSLPIKKTTEITYRGIGKLGIKGEGKTEPPKQQSSPPTTTGNPPFGGFSKRLAKRVTASDFLVSSQTEKEGYGLYSYILFGARPESLNSDRWRRYYEAIVAYLDIPTVGEVSRSVPPESTNLTFLPLAVAESELPAAGLQTPNRFRFDAQRLAVHEALHKAGGKQFPYHDSSSGATACMLVGNYDYARAQGLLAVLPNSHMEGPYIISVAQPLSGTRALPSQYLYQDLSSVPPELIRLWVKEFMAQAQENEFWKTRSKDQFVLRLRTAIGVMSQQIPDLGKSIAWTFIERR